MFPLAGPVRDSGQVPPSNLPSSLLVGTPPPPPLAYSCSLFTQFPDWAWDHPMTISFPHCLKVANNPLPN